MLRIAAFQLKHSLHRAPTLHFEASRSASRICSIKASVEEVRRGRLSEQNLEIAVRHILHDGLVVVENAIDHEALDKLNEKMVGDAQYLRDKGNNTPFNYNRGNLQQDAPPIREFFEPGIFLNPLATQMTSAVLGPRPKLTFMSGNTAMPLDRGSVPQRQPVHSDADFAHPLHAFALVINVPLTTMTPANGSTEIWPGTHTGHGIEDQEGTHGDRASGKIRQHRLSSRQKLHPPLQPVVQKGSIIVRDLRLWHAGMPNHSTTARVMLAMIHFAPWYRNQMRLELGESVRSVVESETNLDVRADFIADEEVEARYRDRGFGNSYNFDQIA